MALLLCWALQHSMKLALHGAGAVAAQQVHVLKEPHWTWLRARHAHTESTIARAQPCLGSRPANRVCGVTQHGRGAASCW
jgi:hypothetical protein